MIPFDSFGSLSCSASTTGWINGNSAHDNKIAWPKSYNFVSEEKHEESKKSRKMCEKILKILTFAHKSTVMQILYESRPKRTYPAGVTNHCPIDKSLLCVVSKLNTYGRAKIGLGWLYDTLHLLFRLKKLKL